MTPDFRLVVEAPRRIGVEPLERAALGPREVRIRTLYSGISAGTELAAYRGSSPFLAKRWNPDTRLFEASDAASWTFPIRSIGYEEVGEIVETGAEVSRVAPGDIVWGTWGHASAHVASEDWAADRLLPDGIDPLCGIFSHIGAIALNAVLDADIHVGEWVAVFGQGVPGLMMTQLARRNGAEVIAVDRLAARLERAKALGAAHGIDSSQTDAAEAVKRITEGRGADVSIEIAGAYGALHDAIRATAYNSRVVVAGFMQGEGRGLALGEEFHHNRIELVCSQIGGLGRRLAHRWDRLRLNRTVMRLQAEGQVDFKALVSHSFKAADAGEAFALLDERPEEALQVFLDFRE